MRSSGCSSHGKPSNACRAEPFDILGAVKQQNSVRPEDAGKRVSFQFELPNGYLGEAVGTFEYFDHEAATYVIRRKDGTLARVPARDVRFGKVVES